MSDFGELIQIVVKSPLVFIPDARLNNHVLEKTRTVKVLEPAELSLMFPLTPYMFGGKSIVMPTTVNFFVT